MGSKAQEDPDLRRYDRFDMERVIEGTPDQLEFALSDGDFPEIRRADYDHVVLVGMGGSALPYDVLIDAFAGDWPVPVTVVRSYDLPRRPDDRTLVIACSFSGTTEETLAAVEPLPSNAPNVVAVTAGGRLSELATGRGYPLARIPREREPDSFQPRCATGYFVGYLARILEGAGVLEKPTAELKRLVEFLRTLDVRSDAEQLASWLGERIPLIYTDQRFARSIARIVKIKLNENAKRPAFYNCLPEANHNEMIGYSRPIGRFGFLYLRDPDSKPRIHRRFDVTRRIFERYDHIELREWSLPGSSAVEKIFSGITFGDWFSYSLALLDGQDPTPVALVEEFKKLMDEPSG